MTIPSMTGAYYTGNTMPNQSPEQKIAALKKQRSEYEEQLKLNGSADLKNKIEDLDKQIGSLESKISKAAGKNECQTCKNRKYKDGSNDPGVSFKTATKVSPEIAASRVRAHEYEHVRRNRMKAEIEGDKIISQTVTIKHSACPECGRTYVSGGETRTVKRVSLDDRFNVGLENPSKDGGKLLHSSV